MKRYVIAIDENGEAYLRRTISVVRELDDSEQTYTVTPVPRPKRLSVRTRMRILESVADMLAMVTRKR